MSRSIKRKRRTRAEIEDLKSALVEIVADNAPATARQVFYLAVSRGLIEKTEGEYSRTAVRLLGDLRRAGRIPWWQIVDFTRTMRKPRSYGGLQELLYETARFYRRDLWRGLDCRVEIWTEKETLTGALYAVTAEFDVPLMPCRGYPSLSFLHAAAAEISDSGKPTWIYYFGDRDPSGLDIPRKVEDGLREFAPEAEIHFERLAVEPWQVEDWGLTTRPTKTKDPRAEAFDGESVEVEAIDPERLRRIVREAIEWHIPSGAINDLRTVEDDERRLLHLLARDAA